MKKLQSLSVKLNKSEQRMIRGGDVGAEAVYKYICENQSEEHPYNPEVSIGVCRHDVNNNCPTTHGDCYYENTSIFV